MLIQNAKVKVLSAPVSGVSKTGNPYTVQDMILSWNEQQIDTSGNTVNVEQTVHVKLGTQWVSYLQQCGILAGSIVNVGFNLRVNAREVYFDNIVNIVSITKVA